MKTALPATTVDFKNGLTFVLDNNVPHKLESFLHVKTGRAAAFVRTKVRNLLTNSLLERTFRAGESIEIAQVDHVRLQYSYEETTNQKTLVFLDSQTFEEHRILKDKLSDHVVGLLEEGMECNGDIFQDEIIDIQLPLTASYVVFDAPPGIKGNSVSSGTKPARLKSGFVVQVPLFVDIGDTISVSTNDGKYLSRVSKVDK